MESILGIFDKQIEIYHNPIGKGASSCVYIGKDIQSDISKNLLAVKIFKSDKIQLFDEEVLISQQLKHPNCMRIIAYGSNVPLLEYSTKTQSTHHIIIMEYMQGGSLFSHLVEPFPQKLARTYFHQLIDGLQYVHQQGYAHRDIKPENILLDGEYTLKYGDFGFTSQLNGKYDDDLMHSQLGTQNFYMAPEVRNQNRLKNEGYDGTKADIYSLAVTLFLLVTGRPPFDRFSHDFAILENMLYQNNEKYWELFKQISVGRFELSDSFIELINGMMDRNPENRFSIEQIKQSKWFKEGVLDQNEVIEMMQNREKVFKLNKISTSEGILGGTFRDERQDEETTNLLETEMQNLAITRKVQTKEEAEFNDILVNCEAAHLFQVLFLYLKEKFPESSFEIEGDVTEISCTFVQFDLKINTKIIISKFTQDEQGQDSIISVKSQGHTMFNTQLISFIKEKLEQI